MSRSWVRSWMLVGVVLAAFPAGASSAGGDGERYALLVGVRQYDPNELRSLPYAEADMTGLAEVLRGAGYRQVVTLSQTAGASHFRLLPTAANIRTTLAGILADRDPGDTVLVAFAGHGVQFVRGGDPFYFCPMDARLADTTTLVSLAEVYRTMERCDAGVKLLLVDSCRNDPQSDNSRSRASVTLSSVTRPQDRRPPGGVAALFSCSPGERAFEHDRLKHGVFFHYVIEGLKGGADLDGDGKLSIEELALYAKRRVPDFVKEEYGFDVRQMPVLKGEVGGLPIVVELGGASTPGEGPRPPRGVSPPAKALAKNSSPKGATSGGMERPKARPAPVSAAATPSVRGAAEHARDLAAAIRKVVALAPAGNEEIRVGLILADSTIPGSIPGMEKALKAQKARVTAISVSDPQANETIVGALGRGPGRAEVVKDYRMLLEWKEIDVVVAIGFLVAPTAFDETFGFQVSGATAIERIISWSAQAGKDCYVEHATKDEGRWVPDPGRTDHPSPLTQPTSRPATYANPIEHALKNARVVSFGGLGWADLDEFFRCVRSRSRPSNWIGRTRPGAD